MNTEINFFFFGYIIRRFSCCLYHPVITVTYPELPGLYRRSDIEMDAVNTLQRPGHTLPSPKTGFSDISRI